MTQIKGYAHSKIFKICSKICFNYAQVQRNNSVKMYRKIKKKENKKTFEAIFFAFIVGVVLEFSRILPF